MAGIDPGGAGGMSTTLPRWADLVLIPALNLLLAFLVAGLVVIFIGEDPIQAVQILLTGSLGSVLRHRLHALLRHHLRLHRARRSPSPSTPASSTSAARARRRSVASAPRWSASRCPGPPGGWRCPSRSSAAGLFGAAWAFIPGYLQAKRGSHVVITTIMFNFIASALVVYLLVNVLKVPGSMAPETRGFPEGTLPALHARDAGPCRRPDVEDADEPELSILALVAAFLTWVLIWRTRLGYEMRAFGHSEPAAVYAGIDPVRITIIAMLLSGAMAGMMALNVVMGFQHRLVLDYVGGAGFVGIAVSLMGRSHPVGVVLAAILFGILYQGGAELAFDMPKISRDMIVVIQALVILFTGALENLVRAPVERAFLRWRTAAGLMDLETVLQLAGSSLRLAHAAAARLPRRALLRARRHLRHRAGRQDAGRRLRRRRLRGGHRLGLDRAPRRHPRLLRAVADPRPRLDHAQGQPAHLRGRDQLPGLRPDRADRAELVRAWAARPRSCRAPSASCR